MDNPNSSNNNLITRMLSDNLRTFFEASNLGYFFIDLTGKIVEANSILANVIGFGKEELVGKNLLTFIGDQNRKQIEQVLKDYSKSTHHSIECELITKKGEKLFTVQHFTFLSANNGHPQGAAILVDNISDYKQTIEQLSKQNHQYLHEIEHTISKFTTLVDNSRDVLYSLYYDDYKFEYLSPSIYEITGFTQEEVLAMNKGQLLQIIHADFRDNFRKHWKSLKDHTDHLNHTHEFKIRPKEGISRWLSDNHKLVFDDQGKLIKLVGNIRDITDFKLVEEALNRSRDRLYKAIEATNDGMWDWRLNTNKVYFDARFYTMLGYTPLEFPAVIEEWMNRIHPDEISNVENLLKQHLEGKSEQLLIEYRFKAKDDSWIWVLNRGKVFERDNEGNPLRMVGTHSDISLRKKAEEEVKQRSIELQIIYEQLQISEEKFRQLAENTQDVFWLRDEDQIIYLNTAFDKVWGHDREEVLLNPGIMQEWIHPDERETIVAWKPFSAFNSKKVHIEQYRIVKPDGEVRWLWSRMFPIFNDKNEIYRLACIASDITEQKRIEEALIGAKEKALESDRLKSAFLVNISHEIRTPMNGIIGFAELLKDESLVLDNRIQYVNIITKSSEQLLHIIDDIIDISKIESNQLNITKSTFLLDNLIKDLQVFFDNEKLHIGKGHIELKIDIDSSAHDNQINTDESRLRQIFMNLISNALKFTEQGYIKFGFVVRSQYSIECFVEDTGIGIAADMQSIIFKRFRQLDDSLTRRFGGTGLGLAISEGLVHLLGGKIWVTSEINKGSTFFFTLPYQEMNATKMQNQTDANINDTFNWQGKTILVVEDDEINQEFMSAVLTPTNVNIIYASTGEDAVNTCLTNNTIDLVLMDIRLPKMNGYEAFTIIHQNFPDLHVIAQTAFAMTEDASRCIEIGFSDYIAKPINRKQFLLMINKHLKVSGPKK